MKASRGAFVEEIPMHPTDLKSVGPEDEGARLFQFYQDELVFYVTELRVLTQLLERPSRYNEGELIFIRNRLRWVRGERIRLVNMLRHFPQ